MLKLFDRTKINIATTGTGDVTFGSASSSAFQTPTEAGCADGDEVRYVIVDGLDYEEGTGTIQNSVAEMARTTVLRSKISGTAGTSKIDLSGAAVLSLTLAAQDILIPANNLADLDDAPTALTNLGGTTVGKALFTAADAASARSVLALPNYLTGLTLSTAGSSATFGIAAGVATDSTNADMMALMSAYTKTTSAWAVGSGNGALDTGTLAMGWYHVFLVKRPDTGVVDVLISANPTTPTLPANYTLFRRVGSMYLNGSLQWRKFSQRGDEFLWDVRSTDYSSIASSTTAADVILDTPYLVPVNALCSLRCDFSSAATSVLFSSKDESDQAPSATTQTVTVTSTNSIENTSLNVRTNNERKIRVRGSGAGANLTISTYGWIDRRGRDG